MRRIVLPLSLFVLLMSVDVHAATLADDHAAEELATAAMSTLSAKGVRGVFETVAPYWTRSKAELESCYWDPNFEGLLLLK